MFGDNYPIFGNKDFYTPEDIVKLDTFDHIKKAIKRYGLEGTEDVIKTNYKNGTKDYLLKMLYEIWKG